MGPPFKAERHLRPCIKSESAFTREVLGGYHESNEEINDMSYFIGIYVSKEKLDCACLRNKGKRIGNGV